MNISNSSIGKIAGVSVPNSSIIRLPDEQTDGKTDRLDVSKRAQEVAAGLKAIQSLPEVRPDKVAQAADKVKQGTLETSGDKLAARLLQGLEKDKE